MSRLSEYIKKIPILFKYYYYVLCGKLRGAKTDKPVLIDTYGLDVNRRTAQIYLQLINTGYEVHLRISRRQYVDAVYYGCRDYQGFLFQPLRYYNNRVGYQAVFCAKDNPCAYEKRISVINDMRAMKSASKDSFFYPLLFHPLKLSRDMEKELLDRPKKLQIGILFLGSTGENYSRNQDTMHNTYKVETRTEIIDFILAHFGEHIYRPASLKELEEELDKGSDPLKDKIVMIDRFRVNGDQFFDIMNKAAFFLWTPGYIQPYCHNHSESMVCGAIPIRNRNIFYQGLEPFDAYAYENTDELKTILEALVSNGICTEDIPAKCDAVKDCFRRYLSEESFHRKLEDFIHSDAKEQTYYICVRE